MIKILMKIKNSTFKAIPFVVCMILLSTAINFYVAQEDSNGMRQHGVDTHEKHIDMKWDTIEEIIELSNSVSIENSKVLAQQMEYDILNNYDNLDDLKDQFDNRSFEKDFYDILKDSVEARRHTENPLFPSPYTIFIAFDHGIISVFSNKSVPSQNKEILPWDEFYSLYPNPASVRIVTDAIKSKESEMLIIQNHTLFATDSKLDDKISVRDLEVVYREHGVEGLSDYSIISPAYIRDNQDLFGTDDMAFMKSTNNNKMYVLQTINIGDILDKYKSTLDNNTKSMELNDRYVENYIYHKNLQTILWSFLLFVISMVLVFIYNHETQKRCCEKPCIINKEEK